MSATIQGQLFKGLDRLIQRLNPTNVSAIQADGINDIIVDYIGIKKDLNTTVHTINNSTPKFSKVLDTEFIADDNTGISMSNLEFINTLYEVEKTAIGNTKLLRDEMNLMGELNTNLDKLDAKAQSEIAKLGRDMNSLPNYVETFKYNANILENVKDMIKAIQMPIDTDTIFKLWTKGTVADRKQWVTDLNKLSSLIKSQAYIEDLLTKLVLKMLLRILKIVLQNLMKLFLILKVYMLRLCLLNVKLLMLLRFTLVS